MGKLRPLGRYEALGFEIKLILVHEPKCFPSPGLVGILGKTCGNVCLLHIKAKIGGGEIIGHRASISHFGSNMIIRLISQITSHDYCIYFDGLKFQPKAVVLSDFLSCPSLGIEMFSHIYMHSPFEILLRT